MSRSHLKSTFPGPVTRTLESTQYFFFSNAPLLKKNSLAEGVCEGLGGTSQCITNKRFCLGCVDYCRTKNTKKTRFRIHKKDPRQCIFRNWSLKGSYVFSWSLWKCAFCGTALEKRFIPPEQHEVWALESLPFENYTNVWNKPPTSNQNEYVSWFNFFWQETFRHEAATSITQSWLMTIIIIIHNP